MRNKVVIVLCLLSLFIALSSCSWNVPPNPMSLPTPITTKVVAPYTAEECHYLVMVDRLSYTSSYMDTYATNSITPQGGMVTLHGYWDNVPYSNKQYHPNDLIIGGNFIIETR